MPASLEHKERMLRHLEGQQRAIDTHSYPPRGLCREDAARYVGVGITKFDEMVADGRMPKAKRVDGRVVWDRLKIDAAFSDLPDADARNPWDALKVVDGGR